MLQLAIIYQIISCALEALEEGECTGEYGDKAVHVDSFGTCNSVISYLTFKNKHFNDAFANKTAFSLCI